MPIESVQLVNPMGATAILNDNFLPLNEFHTTVDIINDQKQKLNSHGLWSTFDFMGRRFFHFIGDVFEKDAASLVSRRRGLLKTIVPSSEYGNQSTVRVIMTFTGMNESVYSDCNLDGWPDIPFTGLSPARTTYDLGLFSTDPRMYGLTVNAATLGAPNVSNGAVWPWTFPVDWGSTTAGSTANVTNIGEATTWPQFVLYGPLINPAISILMGGEYFTLRFDQLNLPVGQTVVVNTGPEEKRNVQRGGQDIYFALADDSVWWGIPPGTWTLTLSAFYAAAPAKAVVYWQNAYMP